MLRSGSGVSASRHLAGKRGDRHDLAAVYRDARDRAARCRPEKPRPGTRRLPRRAGRTPSARSAARRPAAAAAASLRCPHSGKPNPIVATGTACPGRASSRGKRSARLDQQARRAGPRRATTALADLLLHLLRHRDADVSSPTCAIRLGCSTRARAARRRQVETASRARRPPSARRAPAAGREFPAKDPALIEISASASTIPTASSGRSSAALTPRRASMRSSRVSPSCGRAVIGSSVARCGSPRGKGAAATRTVRRSTWRSRAFSSRCSSPAGASGGQGVRAAQRSSVPAVAIGRGSPLTPVVTSSTCGALRRSYAVHSSRASWTRMQTSAPPAAAAAQGCASPRKGRDCAAGCPARPRRRPWT